MVFSRSPSWSYLGFKDYYLDLGFGLEGYCLCLAVGLEGWCLGFGLGFVVTVSVPSATMADGCWRVIQRQQEWTSVVPATLTAGRPQTCQQSHCCGVHGQHSAVLQHQGLIYCPLIYASRRGVSGWMFLLVPAHPGSPGQRAVKRSCVGVCMCVIYASIQHC